MIEFRETKHAEDQWPLAWAVLEAGNKIGEIEWSDEKHLHTLTLAPNVGLLEQGDTDRIYKFIHNVNARPPAPHHTHHK